MNSNLRKVVDHALRIKNEIELKQGVSYNLNTGELNPLFGYMVSLPNHTQVLTSMPDEIVIKEYIKQKALALADDKAYFGCWFDGENYVLDVSNHFERRTDAAFHAVVWNQKAIWDCAKRDEIRIKHKNEKTVTRKYVESI